MIKIKLTFPPCLSLQSARLAIPAKRAAYVTISSCLDSRKTLTLKAVECTMAITIKNESEIEKMRVAGRLTSEVLDFIAPYVKPGVTTDYLDKLCHDYIVDVQQAIPAPLNYAPAGHKPYPKSICASVNHQICHGVPGEKVLKNGDIVNLDITVIKDGYHGDSSRMFYVGEPSIMAKRLCEITYECMWLGIAKVSPKATLGDIGHAIQQHAEKMASVWYVNFAGMGSAKSFTRSRRFCIMANPAAGQNCKPA